MERPCGTPGTRGGPKALLHCMLLMTDLGQAVQRLGDWLVSKLGPPAQNVEHITSVLRQFLTKFTLAIHNPTAETLAHASNLELMDKYYADMVNITKSILTQVSAIDVEALVIQVDEALRGIRKVESCLGMVDLWAGNILIDPHGNYGLIDWDILSYPVPAVNSACWVSTSFISNKNGHLTLVNG